MENKAGDHEGPLTKMVQTHNREGRGRSGSRDRNKGRNSFKNQQPLADHQCLVKINTCPCGVQNHRRRILFKVVLEGILHEPSNQSWLSCCGTTKHYVNVML